MQFNLSNLYPIDASSLDLKIRENNFLDTMLLVGILKTYFERRLDVTNLILKIIKFS